MYDHLPLKTRTTIHMVLLMFGLIPFIIQTRVSAQVIDDFSFPSTQILNLANGFRSGIAIKWENNKALLNNMRSQLIENVARPEGCKDLTGKSLKIMYKASGETTARIRFVQKRNSCFSDQSFSPSSVDKKLYRGTHTALIPFSIFPNAKPALGLGFKITGPITGKVLILRLEVIDTPREIGTFKFWSNALLVDDFSDPTEQWNNLGMKIMFQKYPRVPLGAILRSPDDFLLEGLVNESFMDLTDNSFVVRYSAVMSGPRQFSVRARRLVGDTWEYVDHAVFIVLPAVVFQEIIIPFSMFKDADPTQCVQLQIHGPVFIHRIEIIRYNNVPPPQIATLFHYKVFTLRIILRNQVMSAPVELAVSRAKLYETAYRRIMDFHPAFLRSKLMVVFEDEMGLDESGLSRELFTLLSKEIADPSRGLFVTVTGADYALQINPDSDQLSDYRFVGRVMGMAILHNLMLSVRFVPTIYKLIQGFPVTLDDMKKIDPVTHKSLQDLLLMKNAHEMGLTMTLEHHGPFKKITTINLKPDGANIPLTDENKVEYVNLYCQWKISSQYQVQVDAIREGLHDIIPKEHLARFRTSELNALVSGSARIDIAEWKLHTKYIGGYTEHDPAVVMFWNCVSAWDEQLRSALVQFVTSSPIFPPRELRDGPLFVVSRAADLTRLPSSHTCEKQLDLPPYPDQGTMCAKLKFAVEESASFAII